MIFTVRITALCFAVVMGISCGQPEIPAAGDPDDVVSNTPGSEPSGRGGPQRVEPRDGLVDVRAIPWDRHRVQAEGGALDLFFWHGVEECYGVDRVDVRYGRRNLRVTIYEGRNPEAEVCVELAVRKVVRVTLDEPIGDRAVVDGSREG
jgi:hypothetical protein